MVNEEEAKPVDLALISVSSRIPEFWTDQPALWFVQFEAAIAPQKGSDKALYQLLIAKLGKQVIQQVADILASPPATELYGTLKQRLLSIYEESENRRIQKLISEMQLGDQKPSQLLRRMQSLAGSRMTNDTLLVLWQNHLPSAVRTVLAATTITDATTLASVADKILETSRPVEVAEVTGDGGNKALADAVAKLSIEVAELRRHRSSSRSEQRSGQSSSRTRSASRSRGRSPSRDPALCFYHNRFGSKANNCRVPCAWKKNCNPQGN